LSILNRLKRLNGPKISAAFGCPFGGDVNKTEIFNLTSLDGSANRTEVVSALCTLHRRL